MISMPIEKVCTRLQKMMREFDVTTVDIAERTGLNRTTVWKYVNGKAEPRQTNIYMIASKFNINPAWLLGYDVPMKIDEAFSEDYHPEIKEVSEIMMELGRIVGKLDDSQVDRLLAYAHGMLDASGRK